MTSTIFPVTNNMSLNPQKCKEMSINFMYNHNFVLSPIILGDNVVDLITTYKLLGVYISNDLKWNYHIDYIFKKASSAYYRCEY